MTPSLNDIMQVQDFVGRKEELKAMREALSSDGSRRYVTVHGLGGMGKTQLALQYATSNKDRYSAILWLNIDTKETVATSFAKATRHMLSQPTGNGLEQVDAETDTNAMIEAVKKWLGQPHNTRWLLVFDNYDNPKVPDNASPDRVDIQDFLPTAHQGSVIITTRSASAKYGHIIHLDKLNHRRESLKLLSTTSNRANLDQGKALSPI